MQESIKVSIILPIYNVDRFFDDCMQSIISQTYKNIEIILVDDGSTDDSGKIADKYAEKDKRIVVIHKHNEGVSTARNTGIQHATGEYICFSDPDDILKPDYIEYLLHLCLNNNTDIGICADVFTPFMKRQPKDNIKIITGEQAAAQILYGKITVGCYSKIFKKDFLQKNNIKFISSLRIGEGFNFNVQAFLKATKVAISQHKVYYYRLNNTDSAMSSFKIEKCKMGLEAIQIMRKNIPENSSLLKKAINYADWSTHASMYDWIVLTHNERKFPEMYHLCYKMIRKYAFQAIKAPNGKKNKIQAIIRFIHPYLWAYLRMLARKTIN